LRTSCNENDARRWGFRGDFQGGTKGRRNAMRPSPSPLEPPLEVSETFGGAKVSDDDQLKTELEIQKIDNLKNNFLIIKHYN
jgi:hypothetical protein